MTYCNLGSFLRRRLNNRFTRWIARSITRYIASRRSPRRVLNWYYNLLGPDGKSRFYSRYAKLFRGRGSFGTAGVWNVYFDDRQIRMPLRPSWSWLDWDNAVSIFGHDIEIKKTYSALIHSDQRPAYFLDVGANYGTHSILFLSAGIPAITFEPNPICCEYFQTVCKMNDLSKRWEQVAIGGQVGERELVYPEKDTWLGSLSWDVISSLKKSHNTTSLLVPVRTLDCYLADLPHGNLLIKIDVEGYECEVLSGAAGLIRDRKPNVIFESLHATQRNRLYLLLANYGYCIYSLPWSPSAQAQLLGREGFVESPASNFIAVLKPV